MKLSLRIAPRLSFAALSLACALSAGAAAQTLDCDAAVVAAQESMERTTGNLTGMEAHMAAAELESVHALLAVAGDYLGQAEATCATEAATPRSVRADRPGQRVRLRRIMREVVGRPSRSPSRSLAWRR